MYVITPDKINFMGQFDRKLKINIFKLLKEINEKLEYIKSGQYCKHVYELILQTQC